MNDKATIAMLQKEVTMKTRQVNELLKVLEYAIDNEKTPLDVISMIEKTVRKMDTEQNGFMGGNLQ